MEANFVLSTASRRTPRPTHPVIQCATGLFPRDVKWPGRGSKSDHSLLIAKTKNTWSHASTAPTHLNGRES